MKHLLLFSYQDKQAYRRNYSSSQYRFYNPLMPDLSIIPFYHKPYIYTVNKVPKLPPRDILENPLETYN